MKISLNWLNDYVQTGLNAEEISQILSNLGFPCESIEHLKDDAVIDVEVTSNRGDCLSYIGIARELAVVTGKELKLPVISLDESSKSASEFAVVEIDEPKLCRRYTARVIEGVKIGPSPQWVVKRLEAVGMRSVNNVVDATNYAMMETGQPPHAFDYKKIFGGKIIVRNARAGERIISIDGSKCDLDTNMLVIADSQMPVAVAGVMGGLDSEVSDGTTTVLLEDAWFDPVCVRTTSRKLSLPSDAAFRFERIVDIEMIDWASRRTAQLITQLAGGKVAKGVVDIYPGKGTKKQATLRLSRLKKLLGIEIAAEEMVKILSRLGFNPQQKGDSIECTSPSWRSDIYREADLIEEVARVYGYDKIPTEHKIEIEVVSHDTRQKLTNAVISYLNGCGFYEAVTVTFTDEQVAGLFTSSDIAEHLAVKDVARKSANLLRQNLIGSLLGVLKTNLNVGNTPCRIFEIADTFIPDKNSVLPVENPKLSLVCDGDIRFLRGVIEGLVRSIKRDSKVIFRPAQAAWTQVGAEVVINGNTAGMAGIVSQKIKEKFDFKTQPCAAEIDFDGLLALAGEAVKVKAIPRFPAIDRDLSIIVDDKISWADISAAVDKKASSELEKLDFIEIYRGKSIPAGKKERDADASVQGHGRDTYPRAG